MIFSFLAILGGLFGKILKLLWQNKVMLFGQSFVALNGHLVTLSITYVLIL